MEKHYSYTENELGDSPKKQIKENLFIRLLKKLFNKLLITF